MLLEIINILICMRNICTCVISCLCPVGWPSGCFLPMHPSCVSNIQTLDIMLLNFSTKLFHTCHVYRHHCRIPFIPLSVALNLTGDHKVSGKQNMNRVVFIL